MSCRSATPMRDLNTNLVPHEVAFMILSDTFSGGIFALKFLERHLN